MIDQTSAQDWLRHREIPFSKIEALGGDVSPRKYYRVHTRECETLILAGYPPEISATYLAFQRTTAILRDLSVPIPKILGTDPELRWMLLEDLGPITVYDLRERSWGELRGYFELAAEIQDRIKTLPPAKISELNPHLDTTALWRELEQTFEVFLVPRGLVEDVALRRDLEEALRDICQHIGIDGLLPCHRDFMVRNLSLPSGAECPVVLDHQDLRLGPAYYDLASLCNDSLFPPEEVESEIVAPYLPSAAALDAYRATAVQRALKAIGTFGAFAQRGFPRYLPLIPTTLSRALAQLSRIPRFRRLAGDLGARWQEATA